MYQLDLDSRSKYRYVAYFRSNRTAGLSFGRYFSVEIQCADREWGTLLDTNKRFTIEVCEVEEPETLTRYTLQERIVTSSQDVVAELGRILVTYRAIPSGVPFKVSLDSHSFIQMNSKVKYARECTHYQAANSIYCDFIDVPVNHDDEIKVAWKHFEQGTNRFEILEWMEKSFGYSIASMGVEYAL